MEAEEIARVAHAGQTDKAGAPYIEHPRRVAEWVRRLDPAASSTLVDAAWLHDVLEDTPLTRSDLERLGVPDEVLDIVEAVTKREGEAKVDYFARIRRCPGAVAVKRADLADNTDPSRLAKLSPELQDRLALKYAAAFEQLEVSPVHVPVD